MKTTSLLFGALGSLVLVCAGEESVVSPKLESVGLFKNGLAVVRAAFPVKGPGTYRWEQVPRVVHGSFWIESDGQVSVHATTRLLERTDEVEAAGGSLQGDLAGKEVVVTLKTTAGSAQTPVLTGKVWGIPSRTKPREWDADYSSLQPNSGWRYGTRGIYPPSNVATPAPEISGFLVLEDGSASRRYIDRASIASISVTGPFVAAKHQVERPVLLFDVRQAPSKGGAVRITYLTKGLAWMPAYQVDLSDPATLKIRQNAVVRNESGDLKETEIELISGYPNVRFGSVDSPLWPQTDLASFFQQVNQSAALPTSILSNNIMTQQMAYSNGPNRNDSPPLPEIAEQGKASDDIHYETIGKHSLLAGDSLSLDIAAASAAYERVVEWVVPDPRDSNGRYQRGNNHDEPRNDEPWDAVRFINPFKFPMTTASAVIMEAGKFRGQSLSQWVNQGQRTSLRITKALSVRTESSENEEEGQREIVWVGGNDYQRTKVKGRLSLQNFRGKEVTLTVRCEFSGELLEAEGEPEKSLRSEGVSSVNPRRQLDWTLKLPAGGEKTLNYRYQVLVRR